MTGNIENIFCTKYSNILGEKNDGLVQLILEVKKKLFSVLTKTNLTQRRKLVF